MLQEGNNLFAKEAIALRPSNKTLKWETNFCLAHSCRTCPQQHNPSSLQVFRLDLNSQQEQGCTRQMEHLATREPLPIIQTDTCCCLCQDKKSVQEATLLVLSNAHQAQQAETAISLPSALLAVSVCHLGNLAICSMLPFETLAIDRTAFPVWFIITPADLKQICYAIAPRPLQQLRPAQQQPAPRQSPHSPTQHCPLCHPPSPHSEHKGRNL